MTINPKFLGAALAQNPEHSIDAVIIGRFPPIEQAQSIEATRLAFSYLSASIPFKTITGAGAAQAQIKLSLKSRAKYKTAHQTVIDVVSTAPHTTVFCDMFVRPKFQSKSIRHKALEYIRLMRLFWAILKHAKDVSVVSTNAKDKVVKGIVKLAQKQRPTHIKMLKTAGAAEKIARSQKHPKLLPFEIERAIKLLNSHSIENKIHSLSIAPASRSNLSIYGLPNSATGLGQNARMSAKCFEHLGISPCMVDVDAQKWHQNQNTQHKLIQKLDLHHLNADRIQIQNPKAYNIGFLLWELDTLPKEHLLGLKSLDEIWTPSTFLSELYRKQTNLPVINIKKGIEWLRQITPKPNPNNFTVLNAFDFHSSIERKNPLATAQAFQIAFPKKTFPECRLIFKTTPTQKDHWGDPNNQISKLRKIAFWDKRISIIENLYNLPKFHQLIADTDVVVSSHRAEGFGYIPAYALAYARPLITTDYGGVTDFCTPQTATLIPAQRISVPQAHTILATEGAKWADVSPDVLAQKMRWVYNNKTTAAEKAVRGQKLIQTDYTIAAQAKRYHNRLAKLGLL